MSDEFLNDLKRNWRASDQKVEDMARDLRWKHVWSRLAFPAELAFAAVGVAGGVFLIAADFGAYAMMARIAGAVLLVAVPILTAASWFVRRAHPKWEDETPEGVLRYAQRRLDVVERLLRLARWHAAVLAAFVVALWVFAALGMVSADVMLAGFTVFYLGLAAATFAWARWRMAKLAREREQCTALLAEYRNGT